MGYCRAGAAPRSAALTLASSAAATDAAPLRGRSGIARSRARTTAGRWARWSYTTSPRRSGSPHHARRLPSCRWHHSPTLPSGSLIHTSHALDAHVARVAPATQASFENVAKWLAELKENATADITMTMVGNKARRYTWGRSLPPTASPRSSRSRQLAAAAVAQRRITAPPPSQTDLASARAVSMEKGKAYAEEQKVRAIASAHRSVVRPIWLPSRARPGGSPQVSFMEASALNGGNVEAAFLQARAQTQADSGRGRACAPETASAVQNDEHAKDLASRACSVHRS